MDKEAYMISCLGSDKIGDDGAIIGNTVYTADAFCEGTHFMREWMSPSEIGRKAMTINVSDAIAMNADPLYALVTVSLPREMGKREIRELAEALEQTAAEYGCEIIGGDTVGGDRQHISITLISHSDHPLTRVGLESGDLLAYTGKLGESLLQLEALKKGKPVSHEGRFFHPELRRDFIRNARPMLHAGMDISDGLYCDVNKLLDINDKSMDIMREIPAEEGMSGEEYEMLIAFPPAAHDMLMETARAMDLPLNIFATVSDSGGYRFPCSSHHF